MKDGVNDTPLPTVNTTGYIDHAAFLGTLNPDTNNIPKQLFQCYLNIYNSYVKAPWMPDRTEANPNELNQDDARYAFRCCHFFFSSRRRHTRFDCDWSSDVCSSDLPQRGAVAGAERLVGDLELGERQHAPRADDAIAAHQHGAVVQRRVRREDC